MNTQIEKAIELLETEIAFSDNIIRKQIETNTLKKETLKELYNTYYIIQLSSSDINDKIHKKETLINMHNLNKNLTVISDKIDKEVKKYIIDINDKISQIEEKFIKNQKNKEDLNNMIQCEETNAENKLKKDIEKEKLKKKKELKNELSKITYTEDNNTEDKNTEDKNTEDKNTEDTNTKNELYEKTVSEVESDGLGCVYIFDKGNKKGEQCCRETKYGRYCGYHKKFNI